MRWCLRAETGKRCAGNCGGLLAVSVEVLEVLEVLVCALTRVARLWQSIGDGAGFRMWP